MATILENIFASERKLFRLQDELKTLDSKIATQKDLCAERDKVRASKENMEDRIKALANQINESVSALKTLESIYEDLDDKFDEWEEQGILLFRKAAVTGVRIVFHPDGYEMSSDAKIPGLYTRSQRGNGKYPRKLTGNARLMSDLERLAEQVFPYWKKVFEANSRFWDAADVLIRKKQLGKYDTDESAYGYMAGQKLLILEKHEKYNELVQAKNEFSLGQYKNIDEFLRKLENDRTDCEKRIGNVKAEIVRQKETLAKTDPILAGFARPGDRKVYDKEWLKIVRSAALKREYLSFLPLGENGYYNWLDSSQSNIMISPKQNTFKSLEMLVSVLLLAFPVPSVHITVIAKDKISQFFKDLDSKVCDIIYEDHEISQYFSLLNKMFNETPDADSESGMAVAPKEIVVLTGYDVNVYNYSLNSVKNVLRRGREGGIYFVALPTEDYNPEKDDFSAYFRDEYYMSSSSLLSSPALVEVPDEKAATGQNVVMKEKTGTLSDLIVSYVNRCSVIPNNTVYEGITSGKLYHENPITDLLTQQSYSSANQIVVPFANSTDGNTMELHFATADHFSTFVIGKSGSGKSYLLHSILTNMLLKYDTSIVDLILMDFKMGGVELNYYKDVPHVSKLLVNGSDKQIVCEIMTSLEDEMTKRGEELNRCGVNNIDEYNDYARSHDMPLMRHIILLVDECQGLFKIDMNKRNSREEIQEIVENIARQGRNQGVHLVFATQVFHSSGIPQAAIKQFTDFLFMECTSVDVADCDIDNVEVKKEVEKLRKGEVIHYSHGSYMKGYVYDYAGEDGLFKKKTHDVICDRKRYSRTGEQFYFNASQLYYLGDRELKFIDRRLDRSVMPVAVLGCNLSVQNDPLMIRFSKEEGGNLLIMGYNRELQAERVLWNAVLSLYYSHSRLGKPSQFKVFSTFREDEDSEKYLEEFVNCRYALLRKMGQSGSFEMIYDSERNRALLEIGTLIRRRMNGESKDETVYLVLPNHELYRKNLSKSLKSMERNPVEVEHTVQAKCDDLGFELPNGFGSAGSAPVFSKIDRGSMAGAGSAGASSYASSSVDLNDEFKFVLSNGPEQNVHVLLQVSSPDKVFSGDSGTLRRSEMEKMFNNIVMLRMVGSAAEGLPVQSNLVDKLEMEVQRMRAIVWNEENGVRTFVPYDFPGGKDDQSKGDILNRIVKI